MQKICLSGRVLTVLIKKWCTVPIKAGLQAGTLKRTTLHKKRLRIQVGLNVSEVDLAKRLGFFQLQEQYPTKHNLLRICLCRNEHTSMQDSTSSETNAKKLLLFLMTSCTQVKMQRRRWQIAQASQLWISTTKYRLECSKTRLATGSQNRWQTRKFLSL